jgi:hypothetical protein
MKSRFDFLVETYRTEQLKTLGVWRQIPDERMAFRPEPRAERLEILARLPDDWYGEETTFFDVRRSRAWVLTRRLAHSAHHRGQLTVYLRLWGEPLYSTYGPTADTGGLFQNGARVIYRYGSADDEALPVATSKPLTERPDLS